ncbi:MAG: TIR domain-containing protein [Coleofasciculus sp. C1-SOL-03]|uniref:TIR domain-containing protein n=1 Tax=Coleofasciculus sp. C1-SOL-03 TaxID=3069522 RepID=UPI0032FF27F5
MSPAKPIKVLYCCSDSKDDEKMLQGLDKQLNILQRQGFINTWHTELIGAGKEWKNEIYEKIITADIIMLLISADFFASDYNWNIVLETAKQRHKARKAIVIPILLRRVDNWKSAFDNLNIKALPKGEKPVTDWKPYDNAFENIAKGIRRLIEEQSTSPFSLKSHPWLRAGATSVVRNLASIPTVDAFVFSKKVKSRWHKKASIKTIIVPAIIALASVTAINHLTHISGIPSLVPSATSNSIENINPIGWIRIGVVDNASNSLSVKEQLIQSSNPRFAPSVDALSVPSIGEVVTVKNPVNLRKYRPKPYLPESVGLIKPGEKLVIIQLEPLVRVDSNFPRKEVWAQVGKCADSCSK